MRHALAAAECRPGRVFPETSAAPRRHALSRPERPIAQSPAVFAGKLPATGQGGSTPLCSAAPRQTQVKTEPSESVTNGSAARARHMPERNVRLRSVRAHSVYAITRMCERTYGS